MQCSRTACLPSARHRHGADGGLRSLMALRQILELGCGALVIPEQMTVANADEAFDDMDNLKDESLAAALEGAGSAPHDWSSMMPQQQ